MNISRFFVDRPVFAIVLSVLIVVAGLIGIRALPIFIAGVLLFAVSSLALNLAPSLMVVNVLRAVQGVGAAAALAGGSASLAQEFEGVARTRAFSMIGTTFGVGLAFGPIISGLLIESFGWRSIFLSGTIIGAVALAMTVPRMRESKNPYATSFDWFGALSFTAMLSFLTFALIEGPASGWTSPDVVGLFVATVVALGAFVFVETSVSQPLLQLSLFRYGRFLGVQVLPIATCYSYVVLLILLPLRFVGIEHYSEVEAGMLMLALSGPMLVVPATAAALSTRISAGTLSGLGLVVAAIGLLLLSRVSLGEAPRSLVLPLLLIGVGAGIPWGLMDGLSVTVVPKETAGMASGIFNTTKVAGEGIALAMVSGILATLAHSVLLQNGTSNGKEISAAAQHLATGDLSGAASLLPSIAAESLVRTYGVAFSELLYILIAITLLAAAIVFGLLGRATPPSESLAIGGPQQKSAIR